MHARRWRGSGARDYSRYEEQAAKLRPPVQQATTPMPGLAPNAREDVWKREQAFEPMRNGETPANANLASRPAAAVSWTFVAGAQVGGRAVGPGPGQAAWPRPGQAGGPPGTSGPRPGQAGGLGSGQAAWPQPGQAGGPEPGQAGELQPVQAGRPRLGQAAPTKLEHAPWAATRPAGRPSGLGWLSGPQSALSPLMNPAQRGPMGLPGGMVPRGMVPGGMVPGGMVPGGMVPRGMVPRGMVAGGTVPGGMGPPAGHQESVQATATRPEQTAVLTQPSAAPGTAVPASA